jgi:dTMP kinase
MTEQKPRGLFIVFEGVDRTGKSTQVERVATGLRDRGIAAYEQHFPAYEMPTGRFLRAYLASTTVTETTPRAVHLMFAANRSERMPLLEKLLADGTHVICDRYVYSGAAYSMAKGMAAHTCKAIEAELPQPDAVFYLSAPIDVVAARKDFGDERHDDKAFLERVQQAYTALHRSCPTQRWIEIDASASPESVSAQVDNHMALMLALAERGPLRTLFNEDQ